MSATIDFGAVSLTEYSAQLQLGVLAIDPDALMEPILDLGCGSTAALVAHLAAKGRRVVGVDERKSGIEGTVVGDWLTYPLEPGAWGTIISHMGLSNHFLHHHIRPDGHPERYARRYMEVLEALAPGGTFVYAPGMPFVEDHLPRTAYAVSRFEVAGTRGSELEMSLRARYGADVLYACHVTKLGASVALG